MMTYAVQAWTVGQVWHAEVPQIGRSTQARRPKDIAAMAADLIQAMTDEAVSASDINTNYMLPGAVQDHFLAFIEARREELEARSTAYREQAEVIRAMTQMGYSRRDTGAILGISHQRVQQLVDAE